MEMGGATACTMIVPTGATVFETCEGIQGFVGEKWEWAAA